MVRSGWLKAGMALLVAAIGIAPVASLEIGVRRARACFAPIEEPRGAALPDSTVHARWLALSRRAPWTRRPAELLGEELAARYAVARYRDAAIGLPDRAALRERLRAVTEAAAAVRAGTGRLRLDELGPPLGAPDPGALAASVGDLGSLDDGALDWTAWEVSEQAMEAALLRADLGRAIRLAQHYAGRPDPDQRLRVGALLCAGGRHERGIEEIASVERERAEKRHANMARNFGQAHVLVEACAARGGLAPPPVPADDAGAGELDCRDRLAALRLRVAERGAGCRVGDAGCARAVPVARAVAALLDSLSSGRDVPYRLELVALIAPLYVQAADLATLGRARGGEPEPEWRAPLTIWRMVERGAPDEPFVPPERLVRAAEHARGLDPPAAGLDPLVAAWMLRAAAGMAAGGAPGEARERAEALAAQGARLLVPAAAALAAPLAASSVRYLAGDADGALRSLDEALGGAPAAGRELLGPELAGLLAAVHVQRAEILVGLRRPEAAAAARQAMDVARAVGQTSLAERAAWLALAVSPPGAPTLSEPSAAAGRDSRGPDELLILGGLPPVGPPDADGGDAKARGVRLARVLGFWQSWLAAPSAARRAARYAAMRSRGDAPAASAAYLLLAGRLVDRPEEIEPWLDAFFALDARRGRLRTYAFARAEAARWRGDGQAEALWRGRHRALERLAQDPDLADLLPALRL
ncbi:MAG: hypothetical protein HY744_21155 [Deltaproteobacteria bacterium]|nr:hypothetical protein [Deltaproteobacteria bacterium]